MTRLMQSVETVLKAQKDSGKALAIVLAGHNGSGKSTLWYGKERLAEKFQIPLINADRMMLSILPQPDAEEALPEWAVNIRDKDQSWMGVAQKGVEAFVAQAMYHKVPFAMETVFSYWKRTPSGTVKSKIDLIRQMKDADYFVLLIFIGLANAQLSIARVKTRVSMGGHDVATTKLTSRFKRTQKAIREGASVADATLMIDNSGGADKAFTLCRIQLGDKAEYDIRAEEDDVHPATLKWLNVVSPLK